MYSLSMGALKTPTKQANAKTYIRMMERAQEFSHNIYDEDMDQMEKYLDSCYAFKFSTGRHFFCDKTENI